MRTIQLQTLVDATRGAWHALGNQPNFVVHNTHVKSGVCVWNVSLRSGNEVGNGDVEEAVRDVRQFWKARYPRKPELQRERFFRAEMARQDKAIHAIIARLVQNAQSLGDVIVHSGHVVTRVGLRQVSIPRGEVAWTLCNSGDDDEDPYKVLLLSAPVGGRLVLHVLELFFEGDDAETSLLVDATCSGLFQVDDYAGLLATFPVGEHAVTQVDDINEAWREVLEQATTASDRFLNLTEIWTAVDVAAGTKVIENLRVASEERRKMKQRERKRRRRSRI